MHVQSYKCSKLSTIQAALPNDWPTTYLQGASNDQWILAVIKVETRNTIEECQNQ